MTEDEVVWPVGTTDLDPDLGPRPMVFHPKGFLVAILPGPDEAERAAAAHRATGFADRELRTITPTQILDDHARYTAQMSLPRCVVTAFTDGHETADPHPGHARDGRYALWVHVVDDDEADRAIRGLAGCATLHIRHYAHRKRGDVHLRRSTP